MGSRLPCAPLTTLCGGHSYGYGRPVADPRRAPRATARKRPRARRDAGIETRGHAGRPAGPRARPHRPREHAADAPPGPCTPPRGPPGHTPTRGSTRSTWGGKLGASKAARRGGKLERRPALGPRPLRQPVPCAPGPALCAPRPCPRPATPRVRDEKETKDVLSYGRPSHWSERNRNQTSNRDVHPRVSLIYIVFRNLRLWNPNSRDKHG